MRRETREDLASEEASFESRCSKRSCSQGDQGPSSSSRDEPISGLMKSSETSPSTANQGREEAAMWECAECTLLNPLLAPIGELCTAANPKEKEKEMKHKVWSCKFYTLENRVKLEKCEACGQWRYSYGQPLSTPAPNVGT
ncbi:zinc ion binding [Raphanus sativus]|nr:zinc ion binding [Raphanus sativus]